MSIAERDRRNALADDVLINDVLARDVSDDEIAYGAEMAAIRARASG